ncbi:hypothetical protein JDV02_006897 [Purpureocillium takamizusanense]|uniref:Uncharacterized protein n=1 Tax=Purpureocillium takamizusanense TaxID=2060973 RepID=A0A9Q8QJ86_9HYPO|nr:uncharacterized protein JDV02_006897 [Purpureocillium takamizusanense]UNI20848.1 hypothetical protein JDV02_006897 [Purpureocillium takamizusanense]
MSEKLLPPESTWPTEKLEGLDNFQSWQIKIELCLRCLHLESHLTEEPPTPRSKDWQTDDMRVINLLYHAISSRIVTRICQEGWSMGQSTAKQTFELIKVVMGLIPEELLHEAVVQFFCLDIREFGTIRSYLDKLCWCWNRMTTLDENLDEKLFVIAATQGFRQAKPEWFNMWSLGSSKREAPTESAVCAFLRQHARLEEAREGSTASAFD